MADIDKITEGVLNRIDGEGFKQEGAYNLRANGTSLCHGDTENIKIVKKTDKQGIDVYISKNTQGEYVHIPVVITTSGMTDEVYNDFFVEEGAVVNIVAGCGIHNSGCDDSRHDGVHAFHVGKGAQVRYEEKHYGEGEGSGGRILNPVTKIYLDEDSVFTLDTAQIKGVDTTKRATEVQLSLMPNFMLQRDFLRMEIRKLFLIWMLFYWVKDLRHKLYPDPLQKKIQSRSSIPELSDKICVMHIFSVILS